jgi:galactokinase
MTSPDLRSRTASRDFDLSSLCQNFRLIFGGSPRIFRAPGRVNLIGEHTDYNQGFVMPAAVDLYCWIGIDLRDDRRLHLFSSNLDEEVACDLSQTPSPRGDWTDYIVGTALALEHFGDSIRGANILAAGNIPLGSGLSSSAAIEVATGYALLNLNGRPIDLGQLAVACRRAENEFVGARVGIMDQFISAHGRAGHVLMLDCRSLASTAFPIPADLRLVVCNTGVKHQHAAGEYNARRSQCEEGVRLLATRFPGLESLRDLTPTQLELHKSTLPELIHRRCRHVVTENDRVLRTADALTAGDLSTVGHLMAESHRSLRDDYEVSCPELDVMVEIASRLPGVIGARMTGGGFGGCTINLVHADATESVGHELAREYEDRTRIHPEIYVLNATDGVREITA